MLLVNVKWEDFEVKFTVDDNCLLFNLTQRKNVAVSSIQASK